MFWTFYLVQSTTVVYIWAKVQLTNIVVYNIYSHELQTSTS